MGRRPFRVLLADTEPNFARVLSLALQKRGCDVHTVTDGLAAVSGVRDRPYDLAIVDAALPVMDGLQVMTICAGLRPKLPVIMTCSYDAAGLRQQAKDGGAYAFVIKPADGARLAWLAEQAIASRARAKAVGLSPLAALRKVAPGHEIVLRISSGQQAARYPSTLLERHSRFLAVSWPRSAGGQVSLEVGAQVTVEFGLPDGWYTFSTRVVAQDPHRKPAALLVQPPRTVSRRQRRRYARVNAALPVSYTAAGRQSRRARALSEDISLGGMKLLVGRRLECGTPVAISVRADGDMASEDLSGEVVWTQRQEGRWTTGVKFFAPARGGKARRARMISALRAQRTG